MSAHEITSRPHPGAPREYVSFKANGLGYQATVVTPPGGPRRVVELHRVDELQSPVKWTSIAVSNPRFARVVRVLWALLAVEEAAKA